jgi:hypothetical protein
MAIALHDLSARWQDLDYLLGRLWLHVDTEAFLDTRFMPRIDWDTDAEPATVLETAESGPDVAEILDGMTLGDDECETSKSLLLRARIEAAMQSGTPWPDVPGLDTARTRAEYDAFVRDVHGMGGKVVFVSAGTFMDDEGACELEPAQAGSGATGDTTATTTGHVQRRRSSHCLLQTVTPGVALGDRLILAPEARCSCRSVHSVSGLPLSALVCVGPPESHSSAPPLAHGPSHEPRTVDDAPRTVERPRDPMV